MRNHLLIIISILFTLSCAQTKGNDHKVSVEIDVLPAHIFSPTTELSSQVEHTLISAKSSAPLTLPTYPEFTWE